MAGISIASITGNDGLIAKAKRAREDTIEAAENENRILNELERYIDGEDPNTGNGEATSGGETTNPDDDTVKISKEEFEKLNSKVTAFDEKAQTLETSIQTLEANIQTLTTWKSVDINIPLPTKEWDAQEQVINELKGANRIAVVEKKSGAIFYLESVPERQAMVNATNGIADAYNYTAHIYYDSLSGKFGIRTQRVGSAILSEPDIYLPVFNKIYYKK